MNMEDAVAMIGVVASLVGAIIIVWVVMLVLP